MMHALQRFVCWAFGHIEHSETIQEYVFVARTNRTEKVERHTLTCDRCGRWFE